VRPARRPSAARLDPRRSPASARVTRLVVSTDSEAYAAVARSTAPRRPCCGLPSSPDPTRPTSSTSRTCSTISSAPRATGPTSCCACSRPRRCSSPDDLDAAVDALLDDPDADSAMVVAEARQHPMKAMRRGDADGPVVRLVPYLGRNGRHRSRTARQAYAPAYLRANVVATRPRRSAAPARSPATPSPASRSQDRRRRHRHRDRPASSPQVLLASLRPTVPTARPSPLRPPRPPPQEPPMTVQPPSGRSTGSSAPASPSTSSPRSASTTTVTSTSRRRLIDAAADAGCDAVKFQKRTPELCVPEDQWHIERDTPWGRITYLDYRHRMEFDRTATPRSTGTAARPASTGSRPPGTNRPSTSWPRSTCRRSRSRPPR
jgi:hypothetical protein